MARGNDSPSDKRKEREPWAKYTEKQGDVDLGHPDTLRVVIDPSTARLMRLYAEPFEGLDADEYASALLALAVHSGLANSLCHTLRLVGEMRISARVRAVCEGRRPDGLGEKGGGDAAA